MQTREGEEDDVETSLLIFSALVLYREDVNAISYGNSIRPHLREIQDNKQTRRENSKTDEKKQESKTSKQKQAKRPELEAHAVSVGLMTSCPYSPAKFVVTVNF
jgi:hypothetical protein